MARIRTTHVGSLPRTDSLLAANEAHAQGELSDEQFAQIVTDETNQVVEKQKNIGIDIVNDGEYGHAMTTKVDYGAWWSYSFQRFSGLEVLDNPPAHKPTPEGKLELDAFTDRRDWVKFADAYSDPTSGIHIADGQSVVFPTVTGEIEVYRSGNCSARY